MPLDRALNRRSRREEEEQRRCASAPERLSEFVPEVEVLRLVAEGLTDAEVAQRLVISPRTVNTHLTSIYGKLQVSSRAAATRFAVEHQLG